MVKIPGTNKIFEKTSLGYIVVIVDFFVIIIFLLFTNLLEKSQRNYVRKFYNDTLELTDFTIRVRPMPHDAKYGDSESVLRAFLTTHFREIIKDKYAELELKKKPSGDFD